MVQELYLHEIVLMVCGAILFAVLVCLLIHHVRKGQRYAGLLFFFALPVVMIGFPGIEKIQYEKQKGLILTLKERVRADPADAEARAALAEAVERVEERAGRLPVHSETLTILAEGNQALGRIDQAFEQASRAANIQPDSVRASRLVEELGVEKIERLMPPDARPVPDPVRQLELSNLVSELNRRPRLSAETHLTVSRAALAIGQTNQARSNLAEALQIKTNLMIEPQLKRILPAPLREP
jgi:tetratricopeptide (TPR) repeat protein